MGALISTRRDKLVDRLAARWEGLTARRTDAGELFSDAVGRVLARPDALEVVALDPESLIPADAPDLFHGHRVLGRVAVESATEREYLGRAIIAANRRTGGAMECFDPNVGLVARLGDDRVSLAACFDCGNVEVIGPGGERRIYPLAGWVSRPLWRHLRAAGVRWIDPPW